MGSAYRLHRIRGSRLRSGWGLDAGLARWWARACAASTCPTWGGGHHHPPRWWPGGRGHEAAQGGQFHLRVCCVHASECLHAGVGRRASVGRSGGLVVVVAYY